MIMSNDHPPVTQEAQQRATVMSMHSAVHAIGNLVSNHDALEPQFAVLSDNEIKQFVALRERLETMLEAIDNPQVKSNAAADFHLAAGD